MTQFNKVDEGIQCDMRYVAKQIECRSQDEHDYEGEEENNNYEGQGSSPTWLAQVNKVDEGIQCNVSCYEAQVEKSPQQMPSRGEETASDSKTKGSWKKTVTNRKLNVDKDEVTLNDETEEVYNENLKRCAKVKKTMKGRKLKELSSFSNAKTAYLLKKSSVLTILLPEDSEDSELEEEGDMDEAECLLEEVNLQSPLTSSKGRSYHEAGRIIRSSVPSRLVVWPTRNKCKLLQVCGECECVPAVYQWKRQDGCESTGVRLRSRPAMTKPEGLQSRKPLTNHWSVSD